MEPFRTVFPEEPDEDEVTRAMLISLLALVMVAGSVYMLSPVQRIRAWWNRVPTPTSTPELAPSLSGPTVADNRANNQNLPGTFVENDGDDRDLSPDDFTKPFLDYTEQDVANMTAAWRKCLDGRAKDAAACTERTSQLQTEARNARQTERTRVAAEARRADAAEERAETAEARAEKAETNLRDHKLRFVGSKLFDHNAHDQKMIKQLLEEKEALQSELDACVKAKSRSIRPREIEEYQKQVEEARAKTKHTQSILFRERRMFNNMTVRHGEATRITGEYGTRQDTLRQLGEAKVTVEEQKNEIKRLKANIQRQQEGIDANLAEQHSTINRQAETLRQYKTTSSEEQATIKTQEEALEQYQTECQNYKNGEIRCKTDIASLEDDLENAERKLRDCGKAKKQLQEKSDALLEKLQRTEESLADVYKRQNQDVSTSRRQAAEIEELQSEADAKGETIARLRKRIADLRKGGRGPAACENCKTLQGQITLLQDSQKSQQASFEQYMKQHADMKKQLQEANSLLASNMTERAKNWIQKAQDQTRAVKAERDSLRNTLEAKDDELKKLTDELNALKLGNVTDPDCEERCRKLQAEIGNLKTATAASDCEKFNELQAEIERLKDLLANLPPARRIQQLIEKNAKIKDCDSKIEALRQELAAAKSNTGGADADEVRQLKETVERLENDLSNYPAEIEQLKIWLEDVRAALCSMLNVESGEARISPNEESKPNELAGMLQEVKEQCKRVDSSEKQVKNLKDELKESNLSDYRQEIETLKEYLATTKAELMAARAPKGALRSDPKIKQIMDLNRQVAELKNQLSQAQAPPSAAEDEGRVRELEDELAATKDKLTDCGKHRAEMDDKMTDLEEQLQEALNVNDPDGHAQKLKATNAELNSTSDKLDACEAHHAELTVKIEGLQADLTQARGDRTIAQNDLQDKTEELQGVRNNNAARIAGLKDELEKARSTAPANDADAHGVINELRHQLEESKIAGSDAQQKLEECQIQHAELVAAMEDLQTERLRTKQKRDDCRDKDLPNNKQKVDQLQAELSRVNTALATAEADIEDKDEELENLRNAEHSEIEGDADAAAKEKIRTLKAELDDSKVALGNSRTEAEQTKTKNVELTTQVDKLKKENDMILASGANDGTVIGRLRQEREDAQSETGRIREQATREIQQAQNEKEQLRTDATEKLQEATVQIESLRNAAIDTNNHNGEIQRLQTANDDLIAEKAEAARKLTEAYGAWDHWNKSFNKAEAERSRLEVLLNTERAQAQELSATSFTKDNELKQLRTQLANAKDLETKALADLHGEGIAFISSLQQQLNDAQQERTTTVSSLQVRLSDTERDRDAAMQSLMADNTNSQAAIENSNLRQQLTDLQRRLVDNDNHARSQIDELTRSNNSREQTIQGLNSKYAGYGAKSTASMVPLSKYEALSRENTLTQQENARLIDWKLKTQAPNAPHLEAQLRDEQKRRVEAQDRHTKLFPQINALRKQLAACEERRANENMQATPMAGANLAHVIQMNNSLRADINRNNERYTRQLTELGYERDRLLQNLEDLQRTGGQNDLADCTRSLRAAEAKNADLQAWKDRNEFLVQQADTMAEAERRIAAAKGDVDRARNETMVEGFAGTRGVTRKKEEDDGDSPPRRDAKAVRRDPDDEDLFEGPVGG